MPARPGGRSYVRPPAGSLKEVRGMAMRQPVKASAQVTSRAKPAPKQAPEEAQANPMARSGPLRRLLLQAKERGSVTYDQLNQALPPETSPDQIDELITLLEARGISVLRDDARPEVEIAKRIEAGRNMVLEALCESPLTMRAVIGWRDAIREGRVLLRDIIDLE